MSKREFVSRRRLLQLGAVGGAGAALASVLAACGETQIVEVEKVVTKEVEKIVTKEVPVEKIVTKEVIKEVPVEKIVTKEVTKEVPVAVAVGEPVRGGDLVLSAGGNLNNEDFCSWTAIGSDQQFVNFSVYTSLFYSSLWGDDDTPAMTPQFGDGVAKSYDEVARYESYIFQLDDRFKFHDGKPVTADDFMHTFHMVTHPDYGLNKGASLLKPLKGFQAWGENPTDDIQDTGGIKKLDEMTIQLTTELKDEAFWTIWSTETFVPLPKHRYEPLDPAVAFTTYMTEPVGCGQWIFKRYVSQQFAEMERNPDFPYGAPWADRYIVRYGDPDALDAACEAGELDFHRASSIEAFTRLAQLPYMRAFPQRSPFSTNIVLNQEAEILEGVKRGMLIEGLVHALDRETINAELEKGTLFISDYAFEHVGLMQDPPAGVVRPLAYDPELAKQLITESGWDTNKTIKWMMWSQPSPTSLALKAYWEEVGFKTEFEVVDRTAVIEKLYQERNTELLVSGLGGTQAVGDYWLYLGCGKYYPDGYNYANICDPELDALYEKAVAAPDAETLRERWLDVARRLHAQETRPFACLWRGSLRNLYHRRVNGAYWPQHYAVPCREVSERVWLDPRWDKTTYSG